jgi:hypothetical protein
MNLERNPEKNWNNLKFETGFSIYVNEEMLTENGTHYKSFMKQIIDFVHLGLNLKTNNFEKFDPYFNFSLLNYCGLGNFENSKQKFEFELKVLDFNSDLNLKHDYHWFQFGMGYGYDFFNELEQHLIPLIFLKLGYSSYKLDENIFNELAKNSSLKFSNFEINTGAKINFLINPVELDIIADFTKVTDGPNLNILSIKTKLWLVNQDMKKNMGVNYTNDFLRRYFTFYLSGDYKRYFISNHSQNVFSFSLGIDYYLNHILEIMNKKK